MSVGIVRQLGGIVVFWIDGERDQQQVFPPGEVVMQSLHGLRDARAFAIRTMNDDERGDPHLAEQFVARDSPAVSLGKRKVGHGSVIVVINDLCRRATRIPGEHQLGG